MHSFRAHHVPALDGLRGLAILLVITHHQLVPLSLNGGFLGVDLFFVLSGFLITGLMLKEFDATNSISLPKFYARRVLRLAPALILYLIVSLLLTYRLHPEEFAREIKLVGLALTYLTNWRMAFGWDHSLDPTAIIWSLSIEEQFYLLWPPLLLAALSIRTRRLHIAIALTFIVLGVALHRGMLWSHGADLNRMYYGTDTRADAPLVGCLIALVSSFQISTRVKAVMNISAVVSAICLIYLIAVSTFTDPFLYRGGYTFVAVAAGLVTWCVADSSKGLLARILAWYPLRWFGIISYGLYLWHWLFLRYASFYNLAGKWDAWARFVCAVAISAGSFYLVERQFTRLKTRFSYLSSERRKYRTSSPIHVESSSIVSPFVSTTIIQPSKQEI